MKKITLSNTILALLQEHTNLNDRNESFILTALLIDEDELKDKFELIQKLHEIDGYLDHNLSHYRYNLYEQLKIAAHDRLTEESYEAWHSVL